MEQDTLSRERFIRFGAAFALAPTMMATLASCGGEAPGGGSLNDSGGGQTTEPPESSPETTMEEASEMVEETMEETTAAASGESGGAIAAASDVPPGEALDFEDGGRPAVLVHLETGEFVAYSAVCTHQGCTVAYDSGELACPCHGSVFDPADGAAVVAGPAPEPLAEIPVTESGGEISRA